MIVGTWHVTQWQNHYYDSLFSNTQAYIDTLGKGHSDEENIRIYKVSNVDSIRKYLQEQYDSANAMRMDEAAQTIFKFRKDGIAEVTLGGKVQTGKWEMDDDTSLIMDETNFGNGAGLSRYRILKLNDTALILRFYAVNDTSTVTFAKVEK